MKKFETPSIDTLEVSSTAFDNSGDEHFTPLGHGQFSCKHCSAILNANQKNGHMCWISNPS